MIYCMHRYINKAYIIIKLQLLLLSVVNWNIYVVCQKYELFQFNNIHVVRWQWIVTQSIYQNDFYVSKHVLYFSLIKQLRNKDTVEKKTSDLNIIFALVSWSSQLLVLFNLTFLNPPLILLLVLIIINDS